MRLTSPQRRYLEESSLTKTQALSKVRCPACGGTNINKHGLCLDCEEEQSLPDIKRRPRRGDTQKICKKCLRSIENCRCPKQ